MQVVNVDIIGWPQSGAEMDGTVPCGGAVGSCHFTVAAPRRSEAAPPPSRGASSWGLGLAGQLGRGGLVSSDTSSTGGTSACGGQVHRVDSYRLHSRDSQAPSMP